MSRTRTPLLRVLCALLLIACTRTAAAQYAVETGAPAWWERLEAENRRLDFELQTLHRAAQARAASEPAALEPGQPAGEPEDQAWRKGEYRIVPYGIGWLHMAYESSRTFPGPFSLFVRSPEAHGEPGFILDARPTRFGLDFTGPVIWGAASGGKIEFDFHGQAVTANRAGVLLRHAYGEFLTDQWRFVGGQTTDVISPLVPNVLNYSSGRGAGNIGHRRAQARIERTLMPSENLQWILQGSLNQTVVTDFMTDPQLEGLDAGWPTVMARAAVRLGRADSSPAARPAELGLSGHIAQEAIDFPAPGGFDRHRYLSWSLNADLHVPLTERFGWQGEFFVGQALGTFVGGINQSFDPLLRTPIRAIGGWIESWYYLTEQIHTHIGYAIDDPRNADLSSGRRSLNQLYFANLVYDVTRQFSLGMEVSHWETRYVDLGDGRALRLEGVIQYRF